MFKLVYRIVHSEYDDFVGENGFLQIMCNECKYGELYPEELDAIMDKVSLYNWVNRLIRVMTSLMTTDYVVLSDVESYNTWIEFHRKNEEVAISVLKAEKEQGSQDIEFNLKEPVAGEWVDQVIDFRQMKTEIIEKAREYIGFILANNTENLRISKIKENLETLLKM